MVEAKIRELQKELNLLIDQEADYTCIYELSVKLDVLINQYYREIRGLKGLS